MNALVACDPVADAESLPLDQIDVSDPRLYQNHIWQPYFARLRREDPVHWRHNGMYGSFWSITKYQDIVDVETRHQEFSSEAALGGFVITERPVEYRQPSFIAMDPPKHTSQRRVVAPTFAPTNMQAMAAGIRERVPAPCPNGKSNRVASICVVTSIETKSTQSNTSLRGRPSRMRLTSRWSFDVIRNAAGRKIE